MTFPALFVGHGSPMNAIKDSVVSDTWAAIARELPRPKSILVLSAHWTEPYVAVTHMKRPGTIHDFGPRFPPDLFATEYPAPGSPELAERVRGLIQGSTKVELTQKWGLDHGAWSVLTRMYPEATIPVVELCMDSRQTDEWHFAIGRKLAPLRDDDVLILCSGSLVHNLDASRSGSPDLLGAAPFPWAVTFSQFIIDNLRHLGNAEEHPLVQWRKHPLALQNHPTEEHYLPLLYLLGLLHDHPADKVTTYLEGSWDGPAIAMLSVKISS